MAAQLLHNYEASPTGSRMRTKDVTALSSKPLKKNNNPPFQSQAVDTHKRNVARGKSAASTMAAPSFWGPAGHQVATHVVGPGPQLEKHCLGLQI